MFYLFVNKQGRACGSDKARLIAVSNIQPHDDVTIKESREYIDIANATLGDDGNIQTHSPDIPEPTEEEKRKRERQVLDSQYTKNKLELGRQYLDAMLHGDTDTQEEIKAELQDLDAAYDEAAGALTDAGDDENA